MLNRWKLFLVALPILLITTIVWSQEGSPAFAVGGTIEQEGGELVANGTIIEVENQSQQLKEKTKVGENVQSGKYAVNFLTTKQGGIVVKVEDILVWHVKDHQVRPAEYQVKTEDVINGFAQIDLSLSKALPKLISNESPAFAIGGTIEQERGELVANGTIIEVENQSQQLKEKTKVGENVQSGKYVVNFLTTKQGGIVVKVGDILVWHVEDHQVTPSEYQVKAEDISDGFAQIDLVVIKAKSKLPLPIPPSIETSLKTNLSSSKLSFGQVVEISGKLATSKEADQQIATGAIVEITFTSPAGKTPQYKVETQDDGTYQLLPAFTPNEVGNWQLKVRFIGDDNFKSSEASTSIVVEKGLSAISFNDLDRPESGQQVSVVGTMEPKLENQALSLKIVKPNGSIQATRELKTGSDGGFKHQLSFNQSGNWELVATWAGNSNYQSAEQKLSVTVVDTSPIVTSDDGETESVDLGFARGLEYESDQHTLGLWHFNEGSGDAVNDDSRHNVFAQINGRARWSNNSHWNKQSTGSSFVSDEKGFVTIPTENQTDNNLLTSMTDAVTVEAWVFASTFEGQDGWKMVLTHWANQAGKYHLAVRDGIPQFGVNTTRGVATALSPTTLEAYRWYHVAGVYDGNQVQIYLDGELDGSVSHSGELRTRSSWDVGIGSKHTLEYGWTGLIDEVRISSVARTPEELSPNLQVEIPVAKLVGDVNGDGSVNIFDLVIAAGSFGKTGSGIMGDVNVDGGVNIFDLVIVAGNFGKSLVAAPSMISKIELTTEQKQHIGLAIDQLESNSNRSNAEEIALNVLKAILPERLPTQTQLLPNYPNPFNPETWIPFELSLDSQVAISIYDVQGQLIRQLELGRVTAGRYIRADLAAYWDGKTENGEAVASGTYFYQLQAGDYIETRKMVILK